MGTSTPKNDLGSALQLLQDLEMYIAATTVNIDHRHLRLCKKRVVGWGSVDERY